MEDFKSFTVGERIKYIRKELNLTLEKFGERIGTKRNTMSAIETGRNAVTDQMKKSICREFHINYSYLEFGDGEPFSKNDITIKAKVDQIMSGENDFHRNLIESIIDLDDDTLIMLKNLINKLANKKAD